MSSPDSLLKATADATTADALFAWLDAHALSDPAAAREDWTPLARAALEAALATAPPEEQAALRIRLAALRQWDPHHLVMPEVAALMPGLEPHLVGESRPFAALAFLVGLCQAAHDLGSPWVLEHFAVPPALLAWLHLGQGRWWTTRQDDPYAMSLDNHGSVLANTVFGCETFQHDREADSEEGDAAPQREASEFDELYAFLDAMAPKAHGARGAGMWLQVGSWSDKHDIMVCCHTLGPWDRVADWHDAHPWLNGEGLGYKETDTFLEWLEVLAASSLEEENGEG